MLATIELKDALAEFRRGQTCKLGWRTWDWKKQAGGEWIELDCISHQYLTAVERERSRHKKASREILRNPHHNENSTVNIRVAENGKIITVHVRLIRKFNGKTVLIIDS
jgi:hypothetical protein